MTDASRIRLLYVGIFILVFGWVFEAWDSVKLGHIDHSFPVLLVITSMAMLQFHQLRRRGKANR